MEMKPRHKQQHTLQTDLFHAGLTIAIIRQLMIRMVMDGPHIGHVRGWLSEVRRYGGLAALGQVFGLRSSRRACLPE